MCFFFSSINKLNVAGMMVLHDCAVTLDTECFLLQVSFGFLNKILHVIKDTLEIMEGGGPTLLELLSKASVTHTWTHINTNTLTLTAVYAQLSVQM